MTYTVLRPCAGLEVGDKITAGTLSEVDVSYLLQVGAIQADESAEPTTKRAKKVTTESEE